MAQQSVPEHRDVTRRGFIGWAIGVGTGFVALVAGVPLLGSVAASAGTAKPGQFVRVATVADIPVGEPFGITFVEESTDMYLYSSLPHSVYAVKSAAGEVVVYSPTCPHLGCQVFFDRQKKEYVCPCHASIFSADGARVSGPTPRGLDTLPSKVDKGELLVQWVQYKPGVADKTPV
jgi:Rieske Fe-S protein